MISVYLAVNYQALNKFWAFPLFKKSISLLFLYLHIYTQAGLLGSGEVVQKHLEKKATSKCFKLYNSHLF